MLKTICMETYGTPCIHISLKIIFQKNFRACKLLLRDFFSPRDCACLHVFHDIPTLFRQLYWSYTLRLAIVHTTSRYLIIVLPLLQYTLVFRRVQFLALYFSPCILSLCLPLLTHTLSYTIHLPMTFNYRCLLPWLNIWATYLYAVMYKWCQSLGNYEHAYT